MELFYAGTHSALREQLDQRLTWLSIVAARIVIVNRQEGTDRYMAVDITTSDEPGLDTMKTLRFDDASTWGLDEPQRRLLGSQANRTVVEFDGTSRHAYFPTALSQGGWVSLQALRESAPALTVVPAAA